MPQESISREPETTREEIEHHDVSDETKARLAELDDDTNAILDEIDSVLEENAQEFVDSYIQKGGQ
jgi:ubiquitin-like protein Pup